MDLSGSIMFSWWDFPYDTLFGDPGNDEKSVLRSDSKFFLPQACNPNTQVDRITAPTSVVTGSQFTVSFELTNYGFCHWAANSTAIRLVSKNVWGINSQSLNVNIYPAQPATFTLLMKAPPLKGTNGTAVYDNYWQMQIASQSFGPIIGNRITVTR